MTLRWNKPLAVEVTAAVQRGQADRLRHLIDKHAGLARIRIVKDGESAGSRTLLHLFADWPGHRRNPHEIMRVLPDAGADIEAPGSIIGGLGPIADAAVFGGQRAGLRLVERGARTNLYQAAALGLVDRVQAELATERRPDGERITQAFWAACADDHQDGAALLAAAGRTSTGWAGAARPRSTRPGTSKPPSWPPGCRPAAPAPPSTFFDEAKMPSAVRSGRYGRDGILDDGDRPSLSRKHG
jgi:uncharacterized protein